MWALLARAVLPALGRGAAGAAARSGASATASRLAGSAAESAGSHMLSKAQQSFSGNQAAPRSPQPSYTTASTGPTEPQISSRMIGRGER